MHLALGAIDRLVKKVVPVNALVEKLCEHLLPHEFAHASGVGSNCWAVCDNDWGCGVTIGDAHGQYSVCDDGSVIFLGCGC